MGVGPQGAWLDQASRAGLPVPRGGIVLDDFYRLCLRMNIAIEEAGETTIPSPESLHALLYSDVRFPMLPSSAVIRSAYSVAGDSDERPGLPSAICLAVDVRAIEPLAAAFCHVWSAALASSAVLRRDVLIMEMVQAGIAGSAVANNDFRVDRVTAKRVAQSAHSSRLEFDLPHFSRHLRADTVETGYQRRLRLLLDGLRRTFGTGHWQIKWADDGQVCWLLDVHMGEQAGHG